MGRSMDKHRIANRQGDGVDVGADAGTAASVLDYVSTAAKAGGEIAQQQAAAKKAKADEAERQRKQQAAIDARKAAEYARIAALGESKPNGDLHREAAKKDLEARMLEAEAAGMGSGLVPSYGGPQAMPQGSSSVFTAKNVLIGLGVVVAGFVGYKLLSGHGGTKGRMMRGDA